LEQPLTDLLNCRAFAYAGLQWCWFGAQPQIDQFAAKIEFRQITHRDGIGVTLGPAAMLLQFDPMLEAKMLKIAPLKPDAISKEFGTQLLCDQIKKLQNYPALLGL
jgi:hypothetical protein